MISVAMILSAIVCGVAGAVLLEVVLRRLVALWRLKRTNFPVAPGAFAPLGHLRHIQSPTSPFTFAALTNASRSKTIGVLRASEPCLLTADPDVIRAVCVTHAAHFHSRAIEPLAPDAHRAPNVHVFNARGPRWKRIRALSSSALSTTRLKQLLPMILEETGQFLLALEDMTDQELNVHRLFQRLTAAVIGRSALGLPHTPFNHRLQHFEYFQDGFGDEPAICWNLETLQWLAPTTTTWLQSLQNRLGLAEMGPIGKLNSMIADLTAAASQECVGPAFLHWLKQYEERNYRYSSVIPRSMDCGLLKLAETKLDEQLNPEEIVAQLRFLSIAGFDTTSNTLSFACLLLAENPRTLKLLRKEIESLPVALDYDALGSAKYLHAVILETLRLFPHASMLQSRKCMVACRIDAAVTVPAGVGVLFDTWNLHRQESFWGLDAGEFRPERHLPPTLPGYERHFLPFGAGPRQCIGMRFALLETKAVLVQLLRRFDVHLGEGVCTNTMELSLRNTQTVWPRSLRLRFTTRKGALSSSAHLS